MNKIVTVSIFGCGSRGTHSYGRLMNMMPEKYQIVSLCDTNPEKLERSAEIFKISKDHCFNDDESFFKEKRSDAIIIATLDNDHVWPAKIACRLGYTILLEKPISADKKELNELYAEAKKYNTTIIVCHVLRYTWANKTIMDLLKRETMGKLIQIDHTEQIAYWHFAHSYVRGNWRNLDVSAPMIMAKSCHDLDLLQEYAQSKVYSLSSIGTLNLFKKENQPEGAASRCLNCKHKDTCPYSATRKYIDQWISLGRPQYWPFNVLSAKPLTDEIIHDALEHGPYGRCVYECDNNVCDNQTLMIKFENGVQANFKVTAFTQGCGRITIFHCTFGQIIYDESLGTITEMPFGGENIVHTNDHIIDEFGHGGGDYGLVCALYETITNPNCQLDTSIENSIESHLMAIAAEDSRLADGKVVYLKDYR